MADDSKLTQAEKEMDASWLRGVTEPISAPPTLQQLVEEYNSQVQQGNTQLAIYLLRDALGYCVRYYAGLCVAACRELGCLPPDVGETWSGSPSVGNALPVLEKCLEAMKGRSERLARKLMLVFYEPGSQIRSFADTLWQTKEGFSLSQFCQCGRQEVLSLTAEQMAEAVRTLDAWVSSSNSFFLDCEQRLETGAFFGQLEQVVCFEQCTLRTGLTIRVSESRGGPVLPALAPESSEPGLPESQAEAHSLEAVAEVGAPSGQAVELVQGEPVAESTAPKSLGPEVESLHRLLKDTQRAPLIHKPSSGSVSQVSGPRMEVRFEALGYVKNSQGKLGYGGYCWVDSLDEHPVVGQASSTGGSLQIHPTIFDGTHNRLQYWVHPDDLLSAKEYLKIRCGEDERLYAVWRLAPPGRFDSMGRGQLALLLLVPGLLTTAYSGWILFATQTRVEAQLRASLADNYERYINVTTPLSLKQAGIGQLDVQVKPQIETCLLIYLCVAWLTPVITGKAFAQMARRDQKALILLLLLGCCLPSLVFLGLYGSNMASGPLTVHPELAQIDFRRNLTVFLLLNGFSTLYMLVSVEGFFHRILNDLGRFALATLLVVAAIFFIIVQVYGSSWFG
jgi:hypothetical protein